MSQMHRLTAEPPTSSMADIAFLLLTFFLVTTVIPDKKGLPLLLPQWNSLPTEAPLHKRNIYSIQINSENNILIEGEPRSNLKNVRQEIKEFILNPEHLPTLSESPQKAVVSLKADRGTDYALFIRILDEVQAAYVEIYASRAGISPRSFRELNLQNTESRMIYEKARLGVPMNISMAETSSKK